MIKHTILSLLFVTGIANADPTVVINGGPATSPTSVFTQAYASALNDGEFKLVKTCDEAIALAAQTQKSIYLIFNDGVATSAKQGKNCYENIDNDKVVFMADNTFQVCRKPTTTKKLTDPGVKVGRASVSTVKAFVTDFNSHNNASIVGIPFSGSKAVLAGVLNGDIDYGIIASDIAAPMVEQGKIVCDFDTTEKGSKTKKSLNDHYVLSLDGYTLKYMLIAPNASATDMSYYRSIAKGPYFTEYIKKNGFYNVRTVPSKSDVGKFVTSVEELINY